MRRQRSQQVFRLNWGGSQGHRLPVLQHANSNGWNSHVLGLGQVFCFCLTQSRLCSDLSKLLAPLPDTASFRSCQRR